MMTDITINIGLFVFLILSSVPFWIILLGFLAVLISNKISDKIEEHELKRIMKERQKDE